MPPATATDLPMLTPPLSTVGWYISTRFNNLGKKAHTFFIFLYCRTTGKYKENVLRPEVTTTPGSGQTDRQQTDGHGDSTTEPAQWADSVKILLDGRKSSKKTLSSKKLP